MVIDDNIIDLNTKYVKKQYNKRGDICKIINKQENIIKII